MPLAEDQLTERDLAPVRDLIEEVRDQERAKQLVAATVSWLNAFTTFKKARRRYGLPHGKSAYHIYGIVIADLKTTGKALLVCASHGNFNLSDTPINERNLEACVRELSCDDIILEMGLLQKSLPEVEAALGSV